MLSGSANRMVESMDTSAPPQAFSAAPAERLLRSTIRMIRPVVASNPASMTQTADSIVAGLREAFPALAPEQAPLSDTEREFSKLGCLKLGVRLKPEALQQIRDHLASRPVMYQDENHRPIGNGLAQDAPPEAFVGYHTTHDVLTCPHLIDIANDPQILAIVRAYLGFEPIIDTYLVWHSYAGRQFAGSPQTLHRDKDCFRFCKLFLYLSDVDEDSGPHVFLPNSHNPDRFARLYQMSTNDGHNPLQFFVGGQRGQAPYLEKVFAGKFEHFVGPAGSAFLINTYGLHKGEPPRTRNRILFQALYTLLPYGDVMGTATGHLPVSAVPVTQPATPAFMYRNQLYLRGDTD
jgi:hypothetical protein